LIVVVLGEPNVVVFPRSIVVVKGLLAIFRVQLPKLPVPHKIVTSRGIVLKQSPIDTSEAVLPKANST
jgi:hypothetical protein